MKSITQLPPRIKEVKVVYDRCNAKEVYAVIASFFPASAKTWTPEIVFPFIPEGADAERWVIVLRNVEYNASKLPKKKARKRTRCNLPRKSVNYAEQVTRRSTTAALFESEVK